MSLLTLDVVELVMELTLYAVALRVICLFSNFLKVVEKVEEESRHEKRSISKILKTVKMLRLMCVIVVVTMLVGSSLQACSPFLYFL